VDRRTLRRCHRPADPAYREGDLIINKDGKTAVGTLVERVSRFISLVPSAARNATTASEAVIDSVQNPPRALRRSLTRDCGSETADAAKRPGPGCRSGRARPCLGLIYGSG